MFAPMTAHGEVNDYNTQSDKQQREKKDKEHQDRQSEKRNNSKPFRRTTRLEDCLQNL